METTRETAVADPAFDTELVSGLFGAFGRFRRQVRRLAGRSFDRAAISDSQAEFLRLVGRSPGISVKAVAAEMGLAPNSVSTFVSALVKADLLVREQDPDDRRVIRLTLPAQVQRSVDEVRQRRHEVVRGALGELSAQERDELIRGVAAIDKLIGLLYEREQHVQR
ncbi:MarR family winged helix-turn-helix transcriptional regulator [Nocardia alni]|uniref:MarR family winged helix-turn-helix transcriptional regulator n=1 Tax=Nocardia alni TaxID=2815723 RepID=UPI0027E1C663|nr:MarR family transcriptional regulator [Nocardia alni]